MCVLDFAFCLCAAVTVLHPAAPAGITLFFHRQQKAFSSIRTSLHREPPLRCFKCLSIYRSTRRADVKSSTDVRPQKFLLVFFAAAAFKKYFSRNHHFNITRLGASFSSRHTERDDDEVENIQDWIARSSHVCTTM